MSPAQKKLVNVARALVDDNKGILAADESLGTIQKRFDKLGIESTKESRHAYREMLFTTPDLEKYISGVILFDETLKSGLGKTLEAKGIITGIKVDAGKKEIDEIQGEQVTIGLDGLGERLEEYKKLGARFTKWRSIFKISDNTPSLELMRRAAKDLAKYARICHDHGMVPIIEPEILIEGNHSLEKCAEVTSKVLDRVYESLFDQNILIEGILLKTNFIYPGKDSSDTTTASEVARTTLKIFRKFVSVATPGVVFLSGGLSPEKSTELLNEINKAGSQPWQLSFSFGRALQEPALAAWKGKKENVATAQKELLKRAKLNSEARNGK